MKKTPFYLALGALLAVSPQATAQISPTSDKILIAYYSRSGNTAEIAKHIQAATGGDIFEITPLQDYPQDYRQTTEQAKEEISRGYKPELKNKIENFAQYNIVFLGSPCWWGTIASPVSSFLSSYDFSGKTVIPFMTHGGSGLGHSVEDIKAQIPTATVMGAKAFWGTSAAMASTDVNKWIKELEND